MDDSDTQHLVVLGLSSNNENDALEGLLAAKRSSFSSDYDEEDDFNTSEISEPPQIKEIIKPKETKRGQKLVERKLVKKTIEKNEDVKKFGDNSKYNSKTQKKPVDLSHSLSFQADNLSEDADLLPEVKDLVHGKLLRPLTEVLRVTSLTRIQKQSWKPMTNRTRDVLIRSETGSGKTLAYALPLLHQLLSECDTQPIQRQDGTIIIVLCPTRELVVQVADVFTALTRCALFLTVGGIHGGENRHKEKARLRKGIPILITTPGRLLDHLKATSSFRVDKAQTVVLDEADRLLDMGFEQAIREIMEILLNKTENFKPHMNSKKNVSQGEYHHLKRVLVSATITAGVERLSHFALRKNVVRVGETQDTFSIPSSLRQHYVSVPTKHRLSTLISFLRSQLDAGAQRIIVFVSTADSAEFHYCLLSRLKSPFSSVKRGDKNSFIPRQHSHEYSVKKRTEEANKHVYDKSEDVVTFDDGSEGEEGEEEGEKITLSERNALLNVDIFKLHGNMSQVDRASVFHAFKHVDGGSNSPEKGVLFCTDVAARGLDMPKVDWIIHYDAPTDPACYIHRIGRTARIGNVGDSILFLMPHELGYVSYLSNFIARESKNSLKGDGEISGTVMEERKYESFLFYLTKLDPKANHMWMQSTATLERAISRLVMKRNGDNYTHTNDKVEGREDDLTWLALLAYQSYIRAYNGHNRELKRLCFNGDFLHLGHIAQSFGVDKKPSEVRMQLRNSIKEDRKVAREASSFKREEGGGRPHKKLHVELPHDDRYRSMIVQKQRKITRDWYEKKRREEPRHRALDFSEFDA